MALGSKSMLNYVQRAFHLSFHPFAPPSAQHRKINNNNHNNSAVATTTTTTFFYYISYGIVISYHINRFERIPNGTARILRNIVKYDHVTAILPVSRRSRVHFQVSVPSYKPTNDSLPGCMSEYLLIGKSSPNLSLSIPTVLL